VKVSARDPDLVALIAKIARERGFCGEAYKDSVIRRRIAVRMRAQGVASYAQYASVLDSDHGEYERLLDALTINVSKFFRNRETWDAIATQVVPTLWDDRATPPRCWSAGCASGEEPYTLAILWLEQARKSGGADRQVVIDATDLDRTSLDRATEGVYHSSALDETPQALVSRYFVPGDPARITPELRALVRFQRHDILRDPAPVPPYDLILCRNVVIYFDRPTQDRLFTRFVHALRPGGFLVLGKVEILFGQARDVLVPENPRERIYRRP
jgi:chemotaxis methyl-accepting protein methylase